MAGHERIETIEHADRSSAEADLATILSRLPGSGSEDDVARLMEIYEAGERQYRAAQRAGAPTVGSSASTNR